VTDLADRREPDVARIRGQVREVESIVDDLVESARAGAGQTTVVSLPVDVATLCEGVVSAVPDSSGVTVTAAEATIWADPALTRQILFGLVNNAVRFGGPNVSVTVSRSGPDISIAVRDDGPAVPDSQIERMFSSDLRHGQPVTRPATVGLSLTVGRHLARRMEGDIVYRRTSEGENLYELRLPSERVDRMFDSADEVDNSV
jgi:signal transduction histidine kinase